MNAIYRQWSPGKLVRVLQDLTDCALLLNENWIHGQHSILGLLPLSLPSHVTWVLSCRSEDENNFITWFRRDCPKYRLVGEGLKYTCLMGIANPVPKGVHHTVHTVSVRAWEGSNVIVAVATAALDANPEYRAGDGTRKDALWVFKSRPLRGRSFRNQTTSVLAVHCESVRTLFTYTHMEC